MNQSDLTEKVAATLKLDKEDAGHAVQTILGAVSDALKAGEKVSLQSLGIFEIHDRKARHGRNPATGEAIQIAASKSIKFRPTKNLKDAVSPPTKSTAKPVSKKIVSNKSVAKI